MQAMLDRGPGARRYFSDEFNTYRTLVYYPDRDKFVSDKSQTYSVEADNAELHQLAQRCHSDSARGAQSLGHRKRFALVLDVVMAEDASRIRKDHTPENTSLSNALPCPSSNRRERSNVAFRASASRRL